MEEPQLNRLPDESVHVTGYSREDLGVLEFYEMVVVEPMFCHRHFVCISKPYVSLVLCYSGFYRSTSLSDVHLTTLTECAVYPRCVLSQVVLNWTKETGYFPRRHSNKFNP